MTLTYHNFETFARPSLAGLTCHSVRRKVAGHASEVFTTKLEVTRPPFMSWYVQLWRRVGCTYHSLGALRFPSEVDVQDCTSGLKKWTLGTVALLSCLSGTHDLPLWSKVSKLWYVKVMVRKTGILPGRRARAARPPGPPGGSPRSGP